MSEKTKEAVKQAETITSRDGTQIAYRRSGEGPPLVLVHGTAADHSRWSPVLSALEERFTVYAMDRRGRGGSGDSDGYVAGREFEDVAAVVDSIGEPANLLGHSYGAFCALEAALLTGNVRKLVLYDPGIEVAGEDIYPHEVIERMESMLEAEDRDGVVETTMREVAGLPPETVEHLRTLPVWQARVDAAHTIPRELRAVKAYRFDPERFRHLRVPTLLLSGGDSPTAFKKAAEVVDRALPDSRIVVMPGQGHSAMDTGTDLFTAEVLHFLTPDSPQSSTSPHDNHGENETVTTEHEKRSDMTTQEINQEKAEAFAERMLGMVNEASVALMTSIGHRTGLFDAMAGLKPSTSEEIAAAANLNERYVREWLGAMVTGRIVDYDPEDGTYRLPAEHAAWLTRAASPDNIAVTAQWIPLLGSVEDLVIESFREGGGVPYSAYPRFHEVMAEESSQTVVAALTGSILPLVPGLTERLESGIEVLDVGCGSGRALNRMAREFPKSHFTGYDISEEGISRARAEAEKQGLTNVRFATRDAANLGESARYDLITTFDVVHDQAKPAAVLEGISEALRPDGVYLMQDIAGSSHVHRNLDHPLGPFTYTISTMHCMTVSLEQGGAGLGAMWGEEKAREMLRDAGFTSVEVKQLPHDFINNYYIATKS